MADRLFTMVQTSTEQISKTVKDKTAYGEGNQYSPKPHAVLIVFPSFTRLLAYKGTFRLFIKE
ncbi:hypothetical protein [Salibacterium qingdaonense]|uniref:Uncharacterized protein n=1 Tax=Salibacterium qingdaonense TaxID=266892 RepID=A0A1I4NJM5_9BACI|nr:hypothetical protein [Salibacterium qingdaonense]SFM15752.1 hypothetical protein SAMN04488054_11856 [Salibacterium qingdaonense]